MTDSMFGALESRDRIAITELRDLERTEVILESDRLFAAYALAQLDPGAYPHARWWLAEGEQETSLVCHSRAGLGDATFTMGSTEGVAAILSIQPGQFQTFATAKVAHMPALREAYVLTGAREMRRMHVTEQGFVSEPLELPAGISTYRLRGDQVRALNRLYGSEGGLTSYRSHHVDEGCYFGVVEKGRLVAVAGTHSVSPVSRIAVVGNVFTHPDHRGRGYGTIATHATTQELLHTCDDVVLSVDPENQAAISAYQKLGYIDVGEIVEAAARRRAGAVTVGARRLFASLRGRGQRSAIVHR